MNKYLYQPQLIALLSLMVLALPISAKTNPSEAQCGKHPLYCKILKLRPNIDKKWAMKFSNLLYRYSKKYGMDPKRSLAIAMQETSLRNTNRNREVLVFYNECSQDQCVKKHKIVKGVSDLGVFQFHVKTIRYFNLDPVKLSSSLEYAVQSHFKILREKQERCAHLKNDSWACYHSKTAKYRNRYIQLVNRWYNV